MKNTLGFVDPTRPLIGLNGRFLVAQRTGVQRSAYKLFLSLVEQGRDFNFVLFTSGDECNSPDWVHPNVRTVACNLNPQRIFRNHLWEQFVLPKLARQYEVELLHNPANLAPVLFKGKNIVNIHDVCFLVEPSWFSPTFRLTYSFLVPRIARKAALVITNSNNSKNDILEYLNVGPGKVRFTYWAVEPLFFRYNRPYTQRDDQILFVGSLEPRKNLAGLIAAFNLFRRRNPHRKTRLAVVGCENPLFADINYELGEFGADISFLGYIDDTELARLYGNSKALIYPSFYEGFGFPPLEAMAAGTPVVTSWSSSLPEVFGDSAIIVDPTDHGQIAEKTALILNNPQIAASYIEKGLARAQSLSWERVARHTLGIYSELLGKN
jgi:glycosyltransferase involved in cell wall biosynthesis